MLSTISNGLKHLTLTKSTQVGLIAATRAYPARGTKPLPQYLWDKEHLKEITNGEYTHKPLRVNKLGGRNPQGRKVNQHIGGGTKFDYYMIDFHRRGPTEAGETYEERVLEIRRDANRSSYIALVAGQDGKRWILATEGMQAGQLISTTCHIPENPIIGVDGCAYPIGALSIGSLVNSIERYPNTESEVFVTAAGSNATIMRHQGDFVVVKLPHKHEFALHKTCMATVGKLSNAEFHNLQYGSAQMHRRFGYKMSSGLFHKKDGYCGRKERELRELSWRRILLMIMAVTVHNIPEGMAVGVGFGSIGKSHAATFDSAFNLALGIGLQNFPEGLAVSLPLVAFGYSKFKAFLFGQFSGMVEPISAVLGCYLTIIMEPILPYALSFAAGAMIFVVVDDIIPEAQHSGNGRIASISTICGFILMMSLDVGLG
uniref:Ribosomal_L2_C domain-containing protein n=1 Tax=Rhabditophanes sp. KR3021 TaxID=114890 RepID=A0AC35UFX8_9BILA